MIFLQEHAEKVRKGLKDQTRRLAQPEDFAEWDGYDIVAVRRGDRLLWQVGKEYAVQPGRGMKGIARVRLSHIERELLQAILDQEIAMEGIDLVDQASLFGGPSQFDHTPRTRFAAVWDSIYLELGTRWADNPMVWVLSLDLV